MTGSIGVRDGFGVAERVEKRDKCADLISDFGLSFGVGRESEELVYEEGGAEALPRTCDSPYAPMCQPKRDAQLPEGRGMNVPEDDRLGLVPTPHDEIHSCGQLIQVGGWGSRSSGERHTGIPVTSFLVILRRHFVYVGKGLVGVDYDEVGGGYPRVRIVRAETSVEDGEDGVVSGIYGGGCGGRNEVYEVAGRDGVG